jgi:hypothetical protein
MEKSLQAADCRRTADFFYLAIDPAYEYLCGQR